MSTSSSSNAIFTGSSTYSSDFQNIITRAVSIASLPITQLTNEKTTLSNQSTELGTLGSKFSALQSALQGIDQALTTSYGVTSSAPAVVSASVSAGAVESNYSILVSDAGSYSTMMTGTWDTGAGTAQTYQLWVGNNEYDVTASDNSPASLASAINTGFGDKVHATVVNVGSNSAPDYRVSLQSANLTSDSLDLRSGSTSLAAVQNAGHAAQYEVDNSGTTVSSDTRTVNIATGVTLTVADKSETPVNITVSRSTSGLGSALSSFASAYNAAVAELGAQHGSSAGPLQGDSIVQQLSSLLSGIATSAGSGDISGLSAVGLDLGSDGQLTFNASELAATSSSDPNGLAAFLGSVSGGGFLKTANDTLTSVQDSSTGLLATAQTDLQSQITSLSDTIDTKQTQVDNLQTQLQQQMSAADAAIASMQQQYTYMSNMFQAMQTAEQQYK
jgi:flagellar hook-associated protein 2